jgi:hypothetical protein
MTTEYKTTRYTRDAMADINRGVYERNLPSEMMYGQISFRPSPTKYVRLQDMINPQSNDLTNTANEHEYSVSSVFNPGDRKAPWVGFSGNIDAESTLRNQFMALSRNDRSQWIPGSRSDMYREYSPTSIEKEIQPFPRLFSQPIFNRVNPDVYNLESAVWDNNTRQQLKQKVII